MTFKRLIEQKIAFQADAMNFLVCLAYLLILWNWRHFKIQDWRFRGWRFILMKRTHHFHDSIDRGLPWSKTELPWDWVLAARIAFDEYSSWALRILSKICQAYRAGTWKQSFLYLYWLGQASPPFNDKEICCPSGERWMRWSLVPAVCRTPVYVTLLG